MEDGIASIIEDRLNKTGLISTKRIVKSIKWIGIICFVTTTATQVAALIISKDDPEKFFECCSILSFCGMGILKLCSLCRDDDSWHLLIDQVSVIEKEQLHTEDNLVDYDSDGDNKEKENVFIRNIRTYTSSHHFTAKVLSRFYYFTLVIFIVSPFTEYVIRVSQGYEYKGYPHILPCWSPLDDVSFSGYLLSIFAEIIASIYCVLVHIAFDLSATGLMIFSSGQFVLLREYSETIAGRGLYLFLSKKRDDRAHYRIKTSYKYHVELVCLIDKFGILIKNVLGIYFLVATLALCVVAVRINTETLSPMQLISLLQFMGGNLIQLFIFCYYGDSVSSQSSVGMGMGPFGCAHWCVSARIRKELCILGVGMMKHKYLRAGPFNALDLRSFVQIIRSAYSYYAVIRK